jgi:uncharacterized protein
MRGSGRRRTAPLSTIALMLLGGAAWGQSPTPQAASGPAQASAAPSSFGHYRPPPLYTEQVTSSFYLPMRDGTRLAVTVARPGQGGKPAEGRFPVIWHHSLSATQEPADGTGPRAAGFRSIPQLTDYGYVVVQVARRGNGQSFGTRRGYHDRNEAQDAYEMIEWLAAQPWSSGAVGMYGCSNTGDAVVHAITMRAPHLKAAFAGCFSWNKYDAMRRGGIFAQWGTGPQRTVEQDMAVKPVDGDEDKVLLRKAAEEHQRATSLFDLWKSMPYRDSWGPSVQSPFWSEGSASSYADQMRQAGVKLYIVGGWRDEFRDQAFITHLNMPGSKVMIGDWLHCQNEGFALVEEAHRFFDQWLKAIDTGITREPPIHYFTVGADGGAGAWRSASSWPVAEARPVDFFLARGGLQRSARRGDALSASFPVDYNVACPEAGSGSTVQPCHAPGAGVSLATPPLKVDLETTGHGLADLWVSAEGSDANVFLYLEDVAPDGSVKVVTEGRLKASLRKQAEAPWKLPGLPWHRAFADDAQPLVRGEAVQLQFDILPTSYLFRKGHKLQITVTGSDHRERGRDPASSPPRMTLLSGAARTSRVTLPIVGAR